MYRIIVATGLSDGEKVGVVRGFKKDGSPMTNVGDDGRKEGRKMDASRPTTAGAGLTVGECRILARDQETYTYDEKKRGVFF